jgi:four helix bundle protein
VPGIRRFTDLRAWQACVAYKKAVYRLCGERPLANDFARRDQLERSVAGPPANLAEGFGRFSPADFARYVVIARASLIESQNHLRDIVDKGYISEAARGELDGMAEAALKEVTGLLEYLRSPEALRNARRAQERRMAGRREREQEPRTGNREE